VCRIVYWGAENKLKRDRKEGRGGEKGIKFENMHCSVSLLWARIIKL
jgi:hypothetical protein